MERLYCKKQVFSIVLHVHDFFRYKRSKFVPDSSHHDLLHIFNIHSKSTGGSAVASLKRPFWYRRSLTHMFMRISQSMLDSSPGFLGKNSSGQCLIILYMPYLSFRCHLSHVKLTFYLCPASVEEESSYDKIIMNQRHGAIFLPLRLRSNGLPLLVVNTQLNCNISI
jgi:hypothetical protein